MALVEYEQKGAVGIITLSREDKLNAISKEMLEQLETIIQLISKERVLIITGKGKSFAAGADIKEMQPMDDEAARMYSQRGQSLLNALEDLPCLTIAAIKGHCMGGGLELASCCDIRIASASSLFALPELKLGLIPAFGAFFRVTKLVGNANMRDLLFTGKPITAKRAEEIGLIQSINPSPLTAAMKMAEEFSGNSYSAFKRAKELLNMILDRDRDEILSQENSMASGCFIHNDKDEGIAAFLEKRKPRFE